MKLQYLSLLAAASVGGVSGFVAPKISATNHVSLNKHFSDSTGWDSFSKQTVMPDGEEQRKFRRTVYTHDDWKKHRSQDRFIYYLAAIFKSGVYKNLGREVTMVTAVASLLVVYNCLVGGYTDFNGVAQPALITNDLLQKLTLPMASFTTTSPSLGLLLGKSCNGLLICLKPLVQFL